MRKFLLVLAALAVICPGQALGRGGSGTAHFSAPHVSAPHFSHGSSHHVIVIHHHHYYGAGYYHNHYYGGGYDPPGYDGGGGHIGQFVLLAIIIGIVGGAVFLLYRRRVK